MSPVASSAPPAAWLPDRGAWLERTLVDHSLVGWLYAPPRNAFVSARELAEALARARFILLGEKHDNRDHHRLQAALLGQILPIRRDMAVAFEMLDVEQQSRVDRYLLAHPTDVDGLEVAVDWTRSGWPDWSMYRPLFVIAVAARARIVAANLSRERARTIAHEHGTAPSTTSIPLPPLAPPQIGALERELRESHCGLLPESILPGLVLAQRVRDWTMAERMRGADHGSGVALIAGAGHVRRDRGVPVALPSARVPEVLSVAFVEVQRGVLDPVSYGDSIEGALPFDFVVFTPRVDEKDPCAEMRKNSG